MIKVAKRVNQSLVKSGIYSILIVLTLVNIYFGSYPIIQGEIHFFNDVARDFLLLREIDEKKIMLIGPRSNASGLFHGPLWSYINYPVYLLGNGNPVIVGWYWVFLGIIALAIGYFISKKLFGILPALAYILLYSGLLIKHTYGMFHSEAPVYLTPLFFFTIVLYAKYKLARYLVFHLIILAMIIQLNFGVGAPLLILTVIFSLYLIAKNRSWRHIFIFSLIPLLLSNFIIFDFRHEHLLTKSAYAAWQFNKTWKPLALDFWISNRINETINLHVIQKSSIFNLVIFGSVILFSLKEILKRGKLKAIYFLMIYYYIGYMLLSFLNKGVILGHFVYLLGPLTTLWFASFLRGNKRLLFLPLLGLAAFLNFQYGYAHITYIKDSFIEKLPWSWRSTSRVAESIIAKQKDKPFGYFVFSPDAFAYGPRYAMIYHFKNAQLRAYEYTKKPVTYIIASPPPDNDPYMTHVWWRKNPVGILSEPVWTEKFPSGYTVEEFHLNKQEQNIPHDKTIELGIHFR